MKKKRIILTIIGAAALTAAIVYVGPIIRLASALIKKGVLEKAPDRTYSSSVQANLKALYTAMMFVHESDGQFPDASKWMDAVKVRIQTGDMSAAEAQKKLLDPTVSEPGSFGFAMNDACSQKYVGDVKDPKTVLLFQSQNKAWNAHGDPKKDIPSPARGGQTLGITISGDVVSIK